MWLKIKPILFGFAKMLNNCPCNQTWVLVELEKCNAR